MKKNQFPIALTFEAIMAVFYVFFAYVIVFTKTFELVIGNEYKLPLGLILTVYGLFRVFKVIRKFKNKSENETKE